MKISAAESVVMQALWRSAPQTADQIIAQVGKPQSWTMRTVKTLISRLLAKGAISAQPDGRRYLYSPVLSRDDYVADESDGFVERVFDGRLAPLVMHFAERQKLDETDLDDIRKLLERIDARNGK
ncbi:MAG: BlaI family transcriptional regulator [Caulobacteraceae bacterium]|nr:BlaI family transcriptional regulator [Caulobacteraceae bacterium]